MRRAPSGTADRSGGGSARIHWSLKSTDDIETAILFNLQSLSVLVRPLSASKARRSAAQAATFGGESASHQSASALAGANRLLWAAQTKIELIVPALLQILFGSKHHPTRNEPTDSAAVVSLLSRHSQMRAIAFELLFSLRLPTAASAHATTVVWPVLSPAQTGSGTASLTPPALKAGDMTSSQPLSRTPQLSIVLAAIVRFYRIATLSSTVSGSDAGLSSPAHLLLSSEAIAIEVRVLQLALHWLLQLIAPAGDLTGRAGSNDAVIIALLTAYQSPALSIILYKLSCHVMPIVRLTVGEFMACWLQLLDRSVYSSQQLMFNSVPLGGFVRTFGTPQTLISKMYAFSTFAHAAQNRLTDTDDRIRSVYENVLAFAGTALRSNAVALTRRLSRRIHLIRSCFLERQFTCD